MGFLYNDPYAEILGTKHPKALGACFRDIWAEIWPDIAPLVDAAMEGEATYRENLPLLMDRKGYDEQTWFTFSYSPVRDETGRVAGMFCACSETTAAMFAAKRRDALLELDERLRDVANTADLSFVASEILGRLLGAARVGYGTIDAEAGTITVERNWFAPGFDDQAGVHDFTDYGSYIDDLRRGEAVANTDVTVDPRTSSSIAAFEQLGIRAHLDVPVSENGCTVGEMFVHSAAPRVWTGEEITFVRDFAERTRAAIARRQAEQALRDGEARYRALATVGSSATYRMSPDWRVMRMLNGAGFIDDTFESTEDWVETYIPVDERQKVREAIERVIASNDVFELEHRVSRADGSIGWIFSRAIPLRDANGEVTEWFGAASDITERVRADQSFIRLFEASPAPFLVLKPDAPRFTIAEVNDAYLKATMRAREELVGRGVFEAFPDNPDGSQSVGTLRASLERVLATREPDELPGLKYDIPRGDGSFEERWWSPVNSAVLGEDGEVEAIIHNANDVTDARRAEFALRESEARFRLMADAVPQLVWITDRHGSMEFLNRKFVEFTGVSAIDYQPSEMAQSFIHPEDASKVVATFQESLQAGTSFEIEHRIRSQSGEWRWFVARAEPYRDERNGEVVRWFGASVDIHDRKLAEARLRELNDTLESQVAARSAERDRLWNLSQDMLARADFGGMMSAVSPAWSQVLGWSAEELLSRGYATFMHPEDMPPTLEAIGRMAETRQPTRFENRIATSNGGWKHIEWTVAPEPDGENFIAVGRDLSAAKKREEELKAAQELLRQSQKMEAMGSLTGGVAHDFNNLLTPIIGSLDLLQRRQLGGEREQRLVDGALQSAERARLLVQRLLAFARRQPLQARAVDVGALVVGMADLVASTTGPQIKVVVSVADGLPAAVADPNQIEMAILNLSVNARDAMPNGGTLRISADEEVVCELHRSGLKPGRYVRVSVADDGSGMDETTLARAIEPFFSTKGIGRGTGLGLSMVHGLASQLGGAMTIESRQGLGTNVQMWLPATQEAVRTQETTEEIDLGPATGTALLVDDEDLVRASTADMLAELGYSVMEARSAEEALSLMDGGHLFDLLVTDHLMPGMTGTELAREVRSRQPETRTLVVSGYAEVDGVAPDLPRLVKPFRKTDLAAKLGEFDDV
nr:PAS domain S-box protein [uncultured Sphingomonas sp.]